MMKKPVWIGMLLLLGVLAVLLYSTMTMSKFRVKVCMLLHGPLN